MTGSRILLSIALLFFPVFSIPFFTVYIAAGVSDMLDGAVARFQHTESDFGAKLDSLADFIFVLICSIKIIPALELHAMLWIGIAVVAVIRIVNVISGITIQKSFIANHTFMNKLTGLLLFLFPLSAAYMPVTYCAAVLIVIALFAAIQEGYCMREEHKRQMQF